jgi:hypothetical protein
MPRMNSPTIREMLAATRIAANAVGATRADYVFDGRFRVALAGGWSLLLCPESAGRICVVACYRDRERARMWSPATDSARLTALARSAHSEALALAA